MAGIYTTIFIFYIRMILNILFISIIYINFYFSTGAAIFSPLPQKLNNTKLVYPPPAAYLEPLYLPCFKITKHRVFAYL